MTQMERFFVWLSGTSHDTLVLCGLYERMKYAALGATLLAPAATEQPDKAQIAAV